MKEYPWERKCDPSNLDEEQIARAVEQSLANLKMALEREGIEAFREETPKGFSRVNLDNADNVKAKFVRVRSVG